MVKTIKLIGTLRYSDDIEEVMSVGEYTEMRTVLLALEDADQVRLPLLPVVSGLLHLRDRVSHRLGSDAVISVLDNDSP